MAAGRFIADLAKTTTLPDCGTAAEVRSLQVDGPPGSAPPLGDPMNRLHIGPGHFLQQSLFSVREHGCVQQRKADDTFVPSLQAGGRLQLGYKFPEPRPLVAHDSKKLAVTNKWPVGHGPRNADRNRLFFGGQSRFWQRNQASMRPGRSDHRIRAPRWRSTRLCTLLPCVAVFCAYIPLLPRRGRL